MFDYLDYKNKIPVENYVVKLESINPLAKIKHRTYWRSVKRRCVEGMWSTNEAGEWKWLPGPMFFYINFWSIELKKKGSKSNNKILGKPYLRDIEWIKGFVHAQARGFSGFSGDDEFSCNRVLLSETVLDDIEYVGEHVKQTLYKPDGTLKTYVDALEYLYRYFDRDMGKPLYYNSAKNVIDVETRNIGKTFITACFCGHNFLLDGASDYDDYLETLSAKEKPNSQTLVSAINASYSSNLMKAIILGMDNLPGSIKVGEKLHPSPLSKKYTGSLQPGQTAIQEYRDKIGGQWVVKGTKSKLHHRTFGENEFAANGTRSGFNVIDEVGFCFRLEAILGQLAECTTVDGWKMGTIWMTGTGGDMEGGSTEAAKKVFYNPASYDCLEFDDIFEGSPNKIGFFVPAWMIFDKYRDELGNIDRARAEAELIKTRTIKAKSSSKKPLNDEMQQRPLLPSEAFLLKSGAVFDSPELSEWLATLETDRDGYIAGRVGELYFDSNGKVEFRDNFKLRPNVYPAEEKHDLEGAVVIWKMPEQGSPYSYYIGGLDPYAQDEAPNSESLGSILIFARQMVGGAIFDELVAEYTGRPASLKDFYETCRKLLMFYNGLCLYENNFNGFKEHMQLKNSLHYLANTPTALSKNKAEAISTNYGLRMNGPMKDELILYTRDWLYTDAGDGRLNLHHIYSVPLLKELKAYNDDGNFDRVISLMLFVAQKVQMAKIVSKKKEETKQKWWITHKFNGV